ncbi:MAG: hypothetical protein V4651_02840 [Bacteroidota bacterium]
MKSIRNHRFWLIVILGIISIWGALGERTPFQNGLGWDGKNYATLTSNFEEMAMHKKIDSYQYQRIFTPVVIFYASEVLHIKLSVETIPYVFRVFNILLLAFTVWLFFNLCTHFSFRPQTEIIGFAALFFNYFVLKNTPYYPILTDVAGFWMGMMICYFFLKRKNTALFLSMLLGHFTFPLLLVTSIPLSWNIRNNSILNALQKTTGLKVWAITIIVCILSFTALVLWYPSILNPKYMMVLQVYGLPISIAWVIFYIWKSILSFNTGNTIEGIVDWKKILFTTLGLLAFLISANAMIARISIPEEGFTPQVFLFNIIQQSISEPFISLIAHTIYVGPAILLILLYFKDFTRTIKQQGDSAVGYFIIIALLCLGSESRQFVPYYPFMVLMLMLTLNAFTFSIKQVLLFCLLALVSSKCWFPINVPDIFSKYDFGNFPDQRYFMNQGPFMSEQSYLINFLIVSIMGCCIYLLFRNPVTSHTNLTDSTSPSL